MEGKTGKYDEQRRRRRGRCRAGETFARAKPRCGGERGGVCVSQMVARTMPASASADSPVAAAWEQIRNGLRRDCGARTFDGWLRPIRLGGYDDESGTVRLELPSQFMADWVQTHFSDRLTLAWRSMLPSVRQVQIRSEIGRASCRERV